MLTRCSVDTTSRNLLGEVNGGHMLASVRVSLQHHVQGLSGYISGKLLMLVFRDGSSFCFCPGVSNESVT